MKKLFNIVIYISILGMISPAYGIGFQSLLNRFWHSSHKTKIALGLVGLGITAVGIKYLFNRKKSVNRIPDNSKKLLSKIKGKERDEEEKEDKSLELDQPLSSIYYDEFLSELKSSGIPLHEGEKILLKKAKKDLLLLDPSSIEDKNKKKAIENFLEILKNSNFGRYGLEKLEQAILEFKKEMRTIAS